jgi:protease IV
MRRFIVGFLATLGAIGLLLAIAVTIAVWQLLPPAPPEVPDRAVLTVDLREALDEAPPTDPLAQLGIGQRLALGELLLTLERAASDPRIRGLVARVSGEGPGFAQIQELRDAVARFRAKGNFAFAYSDSFGEFGPGTGGYYLATAFDEIHLQPLGGLGLTGLLAQTPLLGAFLEEIGIEPALDRRGPYKTFADTFTEQGLTPEHREMLEALVDSLFGQIVTGIAQGRKLDEGEVGRLIDGGPYLAEEAQPAGLVDRLSYQDEVYELARGRAGAGAELLSLEDYAARIEPFGMANDTPVIAMIYGLGQIQRGDSDYGGALGGFVMGADTVAEAFSAAVDDPEVEAILFRVDSGGGSAVASETIARAVRRAVEAGKPVVVSMGDTAASGGYWIAMSSSAIVAQPGTLTGSIGVVAGKMVFRDLSERLDVHWGSVQRGGNADMWSPLQGYDAAGRARLQAFLDQVYDAFISGVAQGRDLPKEEVRAAAAGRVWTGAQAHELGLVDELGGFVRALELTKERAGIAPEQPVELRIFPERRAPWQEALALLAAGSSGVIDVARSWLQLLRPGVLSAPPLLIR